MMHAQAAYTLKVKETLSKWRDHGKQQNFNLSIGIYREVVFLEVFKISVYIEC